MMTPAQFRAAISKVESDNNPQAWGDSGLAMGRFQVHPAWVYGWLRITNVQPAVRESWDSFIGRLVEAFYEHASQTLNDVECAMYFHLGHKTTTTQADWDHNYADRFEAASNSGGSDAE